MTTRAHHEFGVDQWASRVVVELTEVMTQIAQVQESIDAAQQMIGWDVILETERLEQFVLSYRLASHHGRLHIELIVPEI